MALFVPNLQQLQKGIIDFSGVHPDESTVTFSNFPNGNLRILNIPRTVTTLRFVDSPDMRELPQFPVSVTDVQFHNCGFAVLRQLPTFFEKLTISNCSNLVGFGEQIRFPGQVLITRCSRLTAITGLQGFIKSMVVEHCLTLERLEVPFFLRDLRVVGCPGITRNGVVVNNCTIKVER